MQYFEKYIFRIKNSKISYSSLIFEQLNKKEMDNTRNQAAQLQNSRGSKNSSTGRAGSLADGTDGKKKSVKIEGVADTSQQNTQEQQAAISNQQQVKAQAQLDWFKFETRIRTVIKDLMEPNNARSQEIEKDNKRQRELMARITKKLDIAEHQIDKIEKKAQGQEELFQKVGALDQSVKINETKMMSELNNMNSNIELVKEKIRSDNADVEENAKQIKKLHESINQLYQQILDAKKDLSEQIQKESKELQAQLLDTKMYFEEQRDHVTQFDSTVQYLQKENLKRKAEVDSHHTQLTTQLDKYQLEIQRAERAYDTALDQFKVVFNQNLDLETKVLNGNKRAAQTLNEMKLFTKKFERYISIVAPMQSFKQMQRVMECSLINEQFNKFIDYAHGSMWPELLVNFAQYDQGGDAQKRLKVDLDHPCPQPELLKHQDANPQSNVTMEKMEEMIQKVIAQSGNRLQRAGTLSKFQNSQARDKNSSGPRFSNSQQSQSKDTDRYGESKDREQSQQDSNQKLEQRSISRSFTMARKPAKINDKRKSVLEREKAAANVKEKRNDQALVQPSAPPQADSLTRSFANSNDQSPLRTGQAHQASSGSNDQSVKAEQQQKMAAGSQQAVQNNQNQITHDPIATKQMKLEDESQQKEYQQPNQQQIKNSDASVAPVKTDYGVPAGGNVVTTQNQNQMQVQKIYSDQKKVTQSLYDSDLVSRDSEQYILAPGQQNQIGQQQNMIGQPIYQQNSAVQPGPGQNQSMVGQHTQQQLMLTQNTNIFQQSGVSNQQPNTATFTQKEEPFQQSTAVHQVVNNSAQALQQNQQQIAIQATQMMPSTQQLQPQGQPQQPNVQPVSMSQIAPQQQQHQPYQNMFQPQQPHHFSSHQQLGTSPAATDHQNSTVPPPQQQYNDGKIRAIFLKLRAELKEDDRKIVKEIVEEALTRSRRTTNLLNVSSAEVKSAQNTRSSQPGDSKSNTNRSKAEQSRQPSEQTKQKTDMDDQSKDQKVEVGSERIDELSQRVQDMQDHMDILEQKITEEQIEKQEFKNSLITQQNVNLEKFKAQDVLINQKFEEIEAEVDKQVHHYSRLEMALKKKSQKESDFTAERLKTTQIINQFKFEIDNVYNKLAMVIQAICCLNEMHRLQSAINHQEEIDKKNVALYGLQGGGAHASSSLQINTNIPASNRAANQASASSSPPQKVNMATSMSGSLMNFNKQPTAAANNNKGDKKKPNVLFTINKMCASCSGQNQHIIKLFKLACIYYQSSKVQFLGFELERDLIADIQASLCNQIQLIMLQNGDIGMNKIMNDKQMEIVKFIEDEVLLYGSKARSILHDGENKITSQPYKLLNEIGIMQDRAAGQQSGYDRTRKQNKDQKTINALAEDAILHGLSNPTDIFKKNVRLSQDLLHVELPHTSTGSQAEELPKEYANVQSVLGQEYSHRTKTPSPKPFKNQQFKMMHDVYSSTALGQVSNLISNTQQQQQKESILTKAASALKFVSNLDADNFESRARAALIPGAIDSESVHNQSNHSTIYAPNNMLSSSRRHQPNKSKEALKKSTAHYLPHVKLANAAQIASNEPDIDVKIKVKNNGQEPISIAGMNLTMGSEESQLRSIYNTEQQARLSNLPQRAYEQQRASAIGSAKYMIQAGQTGPAAAVMAKRTSNQNPKNKTHSLNSQQQLSGKMHGSAEYLRESQRSDKMPIMVQSNNPYNIQRSDQKKLTQFKSQALMRPVTQQYTVGDLANNENLLMQQNQMIMGGKHGAASQGSRIMSLDAHGGGNKLSMSHSSNLNPLAMDEGDAKALGQLLSLGLPSSGSILIKNKLHQKRIPFQQNIKIGGGQTQGLRP